MRGQANNILFAIRMLVQYVSWFCERISTSKKGRSMDVKRLKKIPRKLIAYFENEKIPFWTYIATFFAVIMIRHLLASLYYPSMMTLESTYQFTLLNIALVMMLSIFIHYAASQSIEKICRVLCPAMIILSVSPLIDLLFFFTYFLVKKYTLLRSVIYACGCYVLIYAWSMSPYIVTAGLAALGFFVSLWFAYLINSSAFYSISRNIRVLKITYYLLTMIVGAALAIISVSVNSQTFINIIFTLASVFYAVIFSSLIEMISNTGNDKYSVDADVDISVLKNLALITLALTLLYASFISAKVVLMIASVLGIFFIDEALPFQLRRIPVLSKLVVSSNSLLLILLGFTVVQQIAK